jgi:hypothetical protein
MKLLQPAKHVSRALIGLGIFAAGSALAQQAHTLLGVNCAAPPAYHCPDTDCPGPMLTQPGDSVELKTRRTFFLDCPADYKPGDKVNIVLSLHGYGSYANWQRNYFPRWTAKLRQEPGPRRHREGLSAKLRSVRADCAALAAGLRP